MFLILDTATGPRKPEAATGSTFAASGI